MMLRSCPREAEVKALVERGQWPQACAPELRAHVDSCRSCSELVLVTAAFQRARNQAVGRGKARLSGRAVVARAAAPPQCRRRAHLPADSGRADLCSCGQPRRRNGGRSVAGTPWPCLAHLAGAASAQRELAMARFDFVRL